MVPISRTHEQFGIYRMYSKVDMRPNASCFALLHREGRSWPQARGASRIRAGRFFKNFSQFLSLVSVVHFIAPLFTRETVVMLLAVYSARSAPVFTTQRILWIEEFPVSRARRRRSETMDVTTWSFDLTLRGTRSLEIGPCVVRSSRGSPRCGWQLSLRQL